MATMRTPAALFIFLPCVAIQASQSLETGREEAGRWRREHRTIDLHQHINNTTQHVARAVKIMDAVGIGIGVNLSGGTVTRTKPDAPSEFERNKKLADEMFPRRFLFYMNLDYVGWDEPDFAERAVKQI